MVKTKKILLFLIFSILLINNSLIWADEDFGFINISPELFRTGFLGDGHLMFSGLLLEMYFGGNILTHLGVNYHYLESYGFQVDIGLGYAFSSTFDLHAKYFQFFEHRIDDYWVEQTTIRGTCKAAWLHMIDVGAQAYLLATEANYYDEIYYFQDIMIYVGYCLASYYEVFIPIEEMKLSLHGLFGFKNRTFQPGIVSPLEYTLGARLGLTWYWFGCNLGFYDNAFYFDIGFRIPITIMLE